MSSRWALAAASFSEAFFGPESRAVGKEPNSPAIWLGMPPAKYDS
jgi:hypothetical protein